MEKLNPLQPDTLITMCQEQEKYKRYGDHFSPGRPSTMQDLEKWMNEEICVQDFQKFTPTYTGEVFQPASDPPDVGIILPDGTRIGIEVTELVNSDAIKANIDHFNGKEHPNGMMFTDLLSDEGELWFHKQMDKLISVKERKISERQSGEQFDQHLLLIVSAEYDLSHRLATTLLSKRQRTSVIFQDIYLMLPYSPSPEGGLGKNPVFLVTT